MDKLITQILRGEKGAATKFYHLFAPKIRRYLVVKLPNEVVAEDILQEVFISAFDALPVYRSEAKPLTWLYAIAKHEVADYYRKKYVRLAVEKTSPLFENMVSETMSPEFVYEKKRLEKKFFATYKKLTKQYRDILSHRYELSMSVKEIAERMDLSFKATESLLFRARLAFRTEYERE